MSVSLGRIIFMDLFWNRNGLVNFLLFFFLGIRKYTELGYWMTLGCSFQYYCYLEQFCLPLSFSSTVHYWFYLPCRTIA